MHTNGLAALLAYAEGNSEEAVKKLALMENASFKVVDLLSSLSNQISNQISNEMPKHVDEDVQF